MKYLTRDKQNPMK